ncbi:hypothetical protein SLEP1_g22440 [Rubroshorea leprosula]|uniref:PROP1-like PPR domain-containing protein n=1 Tax=Rubroshorea leprosula TaxID=152421 RepID=A0AAV5JFA5_9ROSI|nr:hypothetical protein SLEP1_g22440 [Rubroshorea leprosula]
MSGKSAPTKPYFFYGHRKPSQNRPVVYGGLFSNRQTLKDLQIPPPDSQSFDLRKWDPHHLSESPSPPPVHMPRQNPKLSPIARFIFDAFRKNGNTWGPPVVSELRKLRRVTPTLVAEVLKVQNNPALASKFFHWAGKQKGFKHNFASYNAFAYCLNRKGLYRAADQLPELMYSQGKSPSEKQFEILIRMHADQNRGLRVYYVYEKMKKFGIKPRVFLYNRIMDALVKNGYLDLALSVYEDFKGEVLAEENITFMILIKGLCKAGRIEEMLQLLRRMREKSCKPDVFAYTAMVKVLVSEGNLDGCLQVWEEMKRDGVKPDMMAYTTLVMGLCKGGRVDRGYEFFKEMKERKFLIDSTIYRVLIEGFVKDGRVGSGFDLLKDLMDSGYRADLDIYNVLIEGLCSAKRVDRAYKLFQITVKEALEPNFATVNPMLVAFAEVRRMDAFCMLLEQMKKLGFSVLEDLSKFFSSVVGKEDRTMMALEVFDDLKVKGYCSTSIYNILMEALHKIGKVKKALSLFGEIKDSDLMPESSTYSVAIMCYVEDQDIQEACLCHNKIVEMSCVPTVDAYCSLARGLCKIGEIDAAMMLVRDCLANVSSGPMAFKYTLAVINACRSDAEKVMEVMDEMLQEGCLPDDVICSAVISGMCKHGTIEKAREIFTNLVKRKLLTEARAIVYDEILIEHMKKKTADLVISGLKFFDLESKLKAKGCNLLSG